MIKDRSIKDTYDSRRKIITNEQYGYYLISPQWIKKKKRALKKKRFKTCCKKGCTNTKVDLHHKKYDNIGAANELTDVVPLCREHHKRIHDLSKETGMSVHLCTHMVIYSKHEI